MAWDSNGNWVWEGITPWADTKLYDADVIVDRYGEVPDGTAIAEINGTRQESYSPTEFTAHIDFICPWVSRYLYQNRILNGIYNAFPPINTSGEVDFTVQCSYFNHYYPAIATQVTVSPMCEEGCTVVSVGGPLTFQPYTVAKLSVDYKGRARPGNVNLQETVTPSLSMRTLPSWGYYWRSDGSPVLDREAPGLQEVKVQISRHLTGIRRIPSWFVHLAGCVNSNPWMDMITGISYLPGTLLFIPTQMERQITMARDDDDYVWDISYEISWNPIGWNNFRRPSGVDCMMYDGNPAYMYTEKEYGTLLVDPNAPQVDQVLGDPYRVRLIDDTGAYFYIGVCFDGTVVRLNENGSIWVPPEPV